MTQSPSGDDPLIHALDGLVRSGALAPERAQAAYEGSLQSPGAVPASEPEAEAEDRQLRLEAIAIAIGVGLLGATIGFASGYSRQDSDLDWSNYLLGIAASLALVGGAAGAFVLVKDDVRKRNLAAWPGAIGAIGVGMMLVIGLDDNPANGYVSGFVTAGLAGGGYYLIRRGAFVIAAIIGLLQLYVALVDDLVDLTDTEGDSTALTVTAAVLIFAIVITAAGWKLPTRDLGGVFVGAFTVIAFTAVLSWVVIRVIVERAFAGFSTSLEESPSAGPDPDRFHDDVYLILLFAVILIAGWAVCSLLSGHVGYRILIVLMISSVVPLATAALAVEHPSWWSAGTAVIGAISLGVVGLRAFGVIGDFDKRPTPRPNGGGSINLDGER